MGDISKYLILNEERNAIDYLNHSVLFLSQVETDIFSLKWFIIAFHGALYSFMLLALQRIDSEQIYQKDKKGESNRMHSALENFESKKVLQFLDTYKLIKREKNKTGVHFTSPQKITLCMKELNNEMRNQVIHFKPMTLGYEPWYPARVCFPLMEILEFCISKAQLDSKLYSKALTDLQTIKNLLVKHSD